MADGGWSVALKKTGTGAITATDNPGYQFAERVRNDLILLGGGWLHESLITCGSRQSIYLPAVADTFEDHPDWVDFSINWTKLKGDIGDTWTVEVVVDLKCENVATTVTPRIVTAGTTTANVTGSAHALTTWGSQTLTLASSTGTVVYRLQIKRSDLNYGVRAVARLRIYV